MKVSVLLPSLYPNLASRAIASLRNTGCPDVDLEIVVCSPAKVEGEGVVWVEDADPSGNNAAIRKALKAATGDFILCFTDDAVTAPDWLRHVLADLGREAMEDGFIVSLNHGAAGTCFGRLYANFPFAHRNTIERLEADYYPFNAHWGDVSFSMAAWETPHRTEIDMVVVKPAAQAVRFEMDRMGNPESKHRTQSFMKDTLAFVQRFAAGVGNGWPITNFRQFNIDLPIQAIGETRSINYPKRSDFIAKALNGQTPLGDHLAAGLWLMPTHAKPERCQQTLNALIAAGTATPGVVWINGGEQPAGYDNLTLPSGWRVIRSKQDLRVCEMYRRFYKNNPDLAWYGVIPDDVVPAQGGWDVELITTAGSKYIASADDGWQNGKDGIKLRMHGATVFGGDLIRAVGALCIDGLQHNCFDDQWETMGRELFLWRFRSDIKTTHEHPWKSGNNDDPRYTATLKTLEADRQVFQEWLAVREATYAKIKHLYPELKATAVNVQGKKVAIATPAYTGMVTTQYMNSMVNTIMEFTKYGVNFDLMGVPGESLLQRARNCLIKMFLDRSCDYLLFIDSDMGWDGASVIRLLAYAKDVVAAAGRRKSDDISFCVNFEGPNIRFDSATGLIAAKEVGTAFMMISRACLEKMVKVHGPHLTYEDLASGIEYVNLFHVNYVSGASPKGKGLLWSEDYTFCQRVRDLGMDVWVDPHIALQHVGTKVYEGALVSQLNLRQGQPQAQLVGAM